MDYEFSYLRLQQLGMSPARGGGRECLPAPRPFDPKPFPPSSLISAMGEFFPASLQIPVGAPKNAKKIEKIIKLLLVT